MNTVLVLSSDPGLVESIRSGLPEASFRIAHRVNVEEAEPLLVHNLANACLLDADLMGVEAVWCVEKIRRHNQKIPLIIFTSSAQAEWEEEVLLRGVSQILAKPVRPRLLVSLLERLWSTAAASMPRPAMTVPAGNTAIFARASADPAAGSRFVNTTQTLDVLRDFSAILTHSLDAEALLKQFLQFLREILSVNRAAIFLNRPCSPLTEAVEPVDGRRLRAAAAIGLNGSLLEHFELSLDSGIGAQIARLGRILRLDSAEARLDIEAQKEFELLGGQVAVPITNRDATIGVAVFDGRITGEPLVNVELELIFHLLEQVGLALRNIWLHDQIAGSNTMMTAVLRELNSACIVVSRDLKVLHANKAARRLLGRRSEHPGQIDFSDLPADVGGKIYHVLNSGAALEMKGYTPANVPGALFNISLMPLRHGSSAMPISALLIAEDIAEREQLRQLKEKSIKDNAELELLRNMSFRMADEINTVVTPLKTHHQLLEESNKDPEILKSLDETLDYGLKRIERLSHQMRYLTPESLSESGTVAIAKVIEEAFQEAKSQGPRSSEGKRGPQLKLKISGTPPMVRGQRNALKHAFAEILLNALQACPQKPEIEVTLQSLEQVAIIEVRDAGKGFSPEEARQATTPFYGEKVGCVGLGLTVSQKIIESHDGKLEIVPGETGVVRVTLPLADKKN